MQKAIAILCVVLLPGAGTYAVAQPPEPFPQEQAPPPATLLTPEQLENLVAPVALYPDPLLGQVLAASTYPLEIVEAQQLIQQHPELRGAAADGRGAAAELGSERAGAGRVSGCDGAAHARHPLDHRFGQRVPGAAGRRDERDPDHARPGAAEWTPAIDAQETVTDQPVDGGPPVIQIQPTNPQIVYVPQYNPEYVWGPPAWGAYPPLWYPSVGFGFGLRHGVCSWAACFLDSSASAAGAGD